MKLFSRIVLFGCIVTFFIASFDLSPYTNHHQENLSVSGERVFIADVSLHVSPGKEAWLVEKIQHAKKRVWVAVYTFTLPTLRESLLQAQNRGVDVQVILEQFPYGNTSINRETLAYLKAHAIPYHESGPGQFSFMHAKYMVIDDEWGIATANWTRASFSTNREFFIHGRNESIRHSLEAIFQGDFTGGEDAIASTAMIVGPTNARAQLQTYMQHSQMGLDIYAPSFTDAALLTHLAQLCYQKRTIRILLDDNGDERPDYGPCIQVRSMKKSLHAKTLIRDKKDAFVGSFNFTKNSLENNREVGIFISGEAVRGIAQIFENDWKSAVVQ